MNVPGGLPRLLLGVLAALLPACAAAQFDLSISPSKTTYPAGEPVFLSLTVKNVSTAPLQISTADPLTFCSGYRFELQGRETAPRCPAMAAVVVASVDSCLWLRARVSQNGFYSISAITSGRREPTP